MNRTPTTVYKVYETEADARDGRFTRRKCGAAPGNSFNTQDGVGPCRYGPLMRGDLNMEVFWWEPDALNAVGKPGDDPYELFRLNLNGNASADDVKAWAWAARWWSNKCLELFNEAVATAPGAKVLGWPKNGPADPRLAPSRKFTISGGGPYDLGGSQYLNGMWVNTNTWPAYLASLNGQIIAKLFLGDVVSLIMIQIVLKHAIAIMHACAIPTPDLEIQKFLSNGPVNL